MLNPSILQKLIDLDINTITSAVKRATQEENLLNLIIRVEPPYYFLKSESISQKILNKNLRIRSVIGYIKVNDITYLIIYVKDTDEQEKLIAKFRNNICDNIFLDIYQHIKIVHKNKPNKENPTTINTFETTSILDDLEELSNELPNVYFSQEHPYIYLYENALKNECFATEKFFKFFCILTLIAEKSNIIRANKNTCYISIKDLMAIIPQSFKRSPIKQKPTSSDELIEVKEPNKRLYQKSYIRFLDFAYNTGMVKQYTVLDNGYIQIVFEKGFNKFFSEPPYIKIPFALVNEITKYNYRFIMYFIKKEFHNNPKYPCFVNIRLKELLELTNITTHDTLYTAAKRLNKYLCILKKYHAIRENSTSDTADDMMIDPNDIHVNELLTFKLYHFRTYLIGQSATEELEEEIKIPKESEELIEPTEAFKLANAKLDELKMPSK